MATIVSQGASATVSLPAGSNIAVTGTGFAVMGPGRLQGTQYGLQGSTRVGPFDTAQTVYLTSTTTALSYTIAPGYVGAGPVQTARNADGTPSGLIDPATGQAVGGGGGVLETPTSARKNILNEEVTFLYNGNNPNDTAYPLTGLFPIADISGAGVIDFINLICTANDAFRSAQLVVFVDGEVTPSINFQMSHFGLDYQGSSFASGLTLRNDKMRLNLSKNGAGASGVQVSFRYEIPFSTGCKVYIYQRQPIMKWWTEVAYRPGVVRPYRLKSKSTNNNGPTFARGGTIGYAAAASSFVSPIDGLTACSLPSYLNATTSTLKDGSLSFMDVGAGKSGSLVGISYGAFNPTADSFSYLETNFALFSATQKAQGITQNSVSSTYHSTGTEDFLGSSFYAGEGIGSWGDYYIAEYATTNNTNGPGAAYARNLRCVVDFMARYKNGIEFTDGAYLTTVQSATNVVSTPSNAVPPGNTTTQTAIGTGISLSFLSLWYEFL